MKFWITGVLVNKLTSKSSTANELRQQFAEYIFQIEKQRSQKGHVSVICFYGKRRHWDAGENRGRSFAEDNWKDVFRQLFFTKVTALYYFSQLTLIQRAVLNLDVYWAPKESHCFNKILVRFCKARASSRHLGII